MVLRLGQARTPVGAVGEVSKEAASLLAAQTGEVSAEEAWNNLRGGDKIKLAGGGWARVQEAAAEEENGNRPADAGVEETPATVPAQSPLPTFLDWHDCR